MKAWRISKIEVDVQGVEIGKLCVYFADSINLAAIVLRHHLGKFPHNCILLSCCWHWPGPSHNIEVMIGWRAVVLLLVELS